MKFPEKYIINGKRKLHSGQMTDIFYDVNALLTDKYYSDCIIRHIPFSEHYVGIATGGAIVAALMAEKNFSFYSIVKDRELKGGVPKENWILIDDVVTTGRSLEEAISIVGKSPSQIWVCVDRRIVKEGLSVKSIFEI